MAIKKVACKQLVSFLSSIVLRSFNKIKFGKINNFKYLQKGNDVGKKSSSSIGKNKYANGQMTAVSLVNSQPSYLNQANARKMMKMPQKSL